jgi:hypothetical protein
LEGRQSTIDIERQPPSSCKEDLLYCRLIK